MTPLPSPAPLPPVRRPFWPRPPRGEPRAKRPLHVFSQRALLGLLLAGAPLAASAGDASHGGAFQTVESIAAAAEGALSGPDALVEASLDPGLRMPPCAHALKAQALSAVNVEVQCPDGWRLFVPVRVQRVQEVLVLTAAIAPGQPIPEASLKVETRDMGRMAGVPLNDVAEARGQTLRRGGRAGQVLTRADLVAVPVLKRGEPVTLVSGSGGFEVRMAGRALADAGPGEVVRVENLSSRRVLAGVAAGPGEVRVGR